MPTVARMNENSPIWRQRRRDSQTSPCWGSRPRCRPPGADEGFGDISTAATRSRIDPGIRLETRGRRACPRRRRRSTTRRSRKGRRFRSGPEAEVGRGDDEAGKKRPQGEGDAEAARTERPRRTRCATTTMRKTVARCGCGRPRSNSRGTTQLAHHDHQRRRPTIATATRMVQEPPPACLQLRRPAKKGQHEHHRRRRGCPGRSACPARVWPTGVSICARSAERS